ncbi:hypothetical protein HPP92_002293 [Vanilla planifolia]|uniref:Glycosyl hydrolase family 32 N-terminal domain-containing protein n=1 Tax=Vanilla planifolia TaxID=51239 RepID=A0A835S1I4_VANPL|nr:hypothetical protein HPP92_002293 [Vanilla planifolia]
MLQWQRTGFHFQPKKNWMNGFVQFSQFNLCEDFYISTRPKAHLLLLLPFLPWLSSAMDSTLPSSPRIRSKRARFLQGMVSSVLPIQPRRRGVGKHYLGPRRLRDLLHWLHLPVAMVPDHWYDINGVWTGSATVVSDGSLVMLYTGSTNATVQVQCLAQPSDPADPLLLHWRKHEANPVLLPPPYIHGHDFRDPTTAWTDPTDPATYLLAIGSKDDTGGRHAGVAYVYSTRDFLSYRLLPGALHAVPGTGMWECVDFFPVSTADGNGGLDTSEKSGPEVKHVLKASMDDDRHDYYAIGTYDAGKNQWVPDDEEKDVGIGLRYDWGMFYAAKTFFDPHKGRRVLWGWVGETDSERADVSKGWASLMSIPRTVVFDSKTGSNLLCWPIEEVKLLRTTGYNFSGITLGPGSIVPLNLPSATQVDIEAEFVVGGVAAEAEEGYNCSIGGGAGGRGLLGPFGLLVLADKNLGEQTATYFYLSTAADGNRRTHFCQDETRPANLAPNSHFSHH